MILIGIDYFSLRGGALLKKWWANHQRHEPSPSKNSRAETRNRVAAAMQGNTNSGVITFLVADYPSEYSREEYIRKLNQEMDEMGYNEFQVRRIKRSAKGPGFEIIFTK